MRWKLFLHACVNKPIIVRTIIIRFKTVNIYSCRAHITQQYAQQMSSVWRLDRQCCIFWDGIQLLLTTCCCCCRSSRWSHSHYYPADTSKYSGNPFPNPTCPRRRLYRNPSRCLVVVGLWIQSHSNHLNRRCAQSAMNSTRSSIRLKQVIEL